MLNQIQIKLESDDWTGMLKPITAATPLKDIETKRTAQAESINETNFREFIAQKGDS